MGHTEIYAVSLIGSFLVEFYWPWWLKVCSAREQRKKHLDIEVQKLKTYTKLNEFASVVHQGYRFINPAGTRRHSDININTVAVGGG